MNRRLFISMVVSLGIVLQLYILSIEYLVPIGSEIWRYRYQSARARSVYMAPYVGKEDAEFLLFLTDETPENVTVYFFDTYGIYSWKPFLQYMLFPRHVNLCDEYDIEICIEDRKAGDILVQTTDEPHFQNGDIEFSFTPFRDSPFLGYFLQR